MSRILSLFAFALLSVAGLRADDYPFTQSIDQTHPFAADGEVRLANVNGSVTIRTWERNEVRIEAEKYAKTQEELDLIELKIEPQRNQLVIDANLPKRRGSWFGSNIRGGVNFVLTVPATAKLGRIDTVNGTISVSGVRGAVHAHSVNGRIEATGLAGNASLRTVNGRIHAEFAQLAAGQQISTDTVNGSSSIALPKDASVALKARCVNGSIDCDFPIALSNSSRRRLSGTIGTGAAELRAETVNGGIHIRQI